MRHFHHLKKSFFQVLFILIAVFNFSFTQGQTQRLSGTIKDATTGETLIGANVIYAPGKGTVSDIDGNFSFDLTPGTYEVHISFIGYNEVIKQVELGSSPVHLNIMMDIIELDEVLIVADIARERSTPIAFSSVSQKQIAQEQGTQDLPMLLNYTPGVYATQQGGGDGDARITIRGFDQTNLAVMIDGIPVNDMENGWVYWSNWNLPVKTMQVQRGLSASKLALPSVGGTVNILTLGIDAKPGLKFKQDFASGNYTRTGITLNSGKLKGDWGIVFDGSYRQANGIVNGNFTDAFSYFLKVEKFTDRHRLSLTAVGAPQKHGQRSYKGEISLYSRELAAKAGVPDSVMNGIPEMGIIYNEHWGTYERYDVIGNGVNNNPLDPNKLEYVDSTITRRGSIVRQSEIMNYYYKPLFSLRDFWTIGENTVWVNTFYASYGWGGGTGLNTRSGVTFDENQQIQFQDVYFGNRINTNDQGFDNTFRTIDTTISDTEYKGSNYLRSSVNNHSWYGLLSQITQKINPSLTFSGGIDLRTYKGVHYRQIYNLMGADYILENSNANQNGLSIKREGDKVYYYDEGHVRWAGFFSQLEYTNGTISAFANLTGSMTSYNGIDYYRLNDENDQTYQTGWQDFFGYTVKLGANYNFNENMNVFINTGYLNNAPKFNSVIDISNNVVEGVENENVLAFELGYALSTRTVSLNVNAYYTKWDNKPINRNVSVPHPEIAGENATVFIPSMDALHQGVEFDAAWVFLPKWKLQALFSFGDWTWQSQEKVNYQFNGSPILDDAGNPLQLEVDPRGVHVGDAAQFQVGGALDFNPDKNSYLRFRYTYFGKNFSQFNPESVVGDNAGRDSWQIPNYQLIDFFAGYKFEFEKMSLNFGLAVNNVLNSLYISDALNNETRSRFVQTSNFDAASAGIFPGLPRRYSFSITLEL
jgi:outer membrane cobalamin receptor